MSSSTDHGASWEQVLGKKLVRSAGEGAVEVVDTATALKGKHVGLYFSAHWCPPCRQFTPRMADTYSKLAKDGVEWEVVYVSCDRNKHQFEASQAVEYFSSMPWLAIPFEDSALRNTLKFRVQGIPTLVMMAPDTTILSANARAAVGVDANGAGFPWAGVSEPKGFPLPWMMLAILVFWIVQTFVVPKFRG
ncbi:nucleoredoxin [Monoraphidium neglectum]|uniref:Nucleoredoxin n=1 Tax=Monoraphidium neglectum TaxID=145388 RepID=A0A0D2LFJ9_9CHLO|nr:nucleoredoxin [Monoraphidium neglectum]KIZ05414.1 nucleoredoxin [Monoraphidium neglectum]|eukprot:XP_013904433.1 nucleoredoxin [Monoraphidium neglectum]